MARFLTLFTLVFALALAAMNPVGNWSCTATTPDGDEVPWSMEISGNSGHYVAVLTSERGKMNIPQTRVDGNTLTFQVNVGGEGTFTISLTFDGDTFRGSWKGDDRGGELKGKRKAT